MSGNTEITHLGAIKDILLEIEKNLKSIDYWNKENEVGVVEIINKDTQSGCKILKMHLKYLSNKF